MRTQIPFNHSPTPTQRRTKATDMPFQKPNSIQSHTIRHQGGKPEGEGREGWAGMDTSWRRRWSRVRGLVVGKAGHGRGEDDEAPGSTRWCFSPAVAALFSGRKSRNCPRTPKEFLFLHPPLPFLSSLVLLPITEIRLRNRVAGSKGRKEIRLRSMKEVSPSDPYLRVEGSAVNHRVLSLNQAAVHQP